MWTLIVLGLVFLGWYIMSPQGEAGATAEAPAPEAPEAPAADAPAEDHGVTDGSEFASAQAAGGGEEAPAPAAAEAPAESGGSGADDPFKAPGS